MRSKKTNTGFVVVLARGEEVIKNLTDFCAKEHIRAATFTGIGAVEHVKIGYYDLEKKEYFFRDESGVFEVASMQGNVALVDDAPFIHAHAVLSRCDETCACIGAHIKEAYVAVTLEVFLIPLDMQLSRTLNGDIGLKLLDL